MKLPKKAQYAISYALYLQTVGQSNTASAASALGLSTTFLEQVARHLRIAGLLTVKRGPGGGYSLSGAPTIGSILNAVGVGQLISKSVDITAGQTVPYLDVVTDLQQGLDSLLSRSLSDYATPEIKVAEVPAVSEGVTEASV